MSAITFQAEYQAWMRGKPCDSRDCPKPGLDATCDGACQIYDDWLRDEPNEDADDMPIEGEEG